MKATIFAGSTSDLVNGSPTNEIKVSKGIRKGDPLAPFLFLVAAEGLSSLIKKATDLYIFKGLSLVDNLPVITNLQFADDTLIVGEAIYDNLWAIKTIFRCFELASGLKVNFHKSNISGMNVDNSFLIAASDFLNCNIGSIPFCYLGLPIGANPRRFWTLENRYWRV